PEGGAPHPRRGGAPEGERIEAEAQDPRVPPRERRAAPRNRAPRPRPLRRRPVGRRPRHEQGEGLPGRDAPPQLLGPAPDARPHDAPPDGRRRSGHRSRPHLERQGHAGTTGQRPQDGPEPEDRAEAVGGQCPPRERRGAGRERRLRRDPPREEERSSRKEPEGRRRRLSPASEPTDGKEDSPWQRRLSISKARKARTSPS